MRPHRQQPIRLPVPGILQTRTLEWVAISFSNAWKWKVKVKLLSCIQLFVTPWTAAYQAPPSLGFSRQEYWSGVPSPSPATLLLTHWILLHGLLCCTRNECVKCLPPWGLGTYCFFPGLSFSRCPGVFKTYFRSLLQCHLLNEPPASLSALFNNAFSLFSDMQMIPPLWQKVKN